MTTQLVEQVGALDTDSKAKFFEQALGNLTVGEALVLVRHLEETWDVEAVPQMDQQIGPRLDLFEPEAVEQTEFDVVLKDAGQKKIALYKEVRALTNMNLKDAKALVDKAPIAIKEKLSKDEANKAVATLEEAGATVELR